MQTEPTLALSCGILLLSPCYAQPLWEEVKMKRSLLLGLTLAVVLGGTSLPAAAVNCKAVNKMLKTGRTPQELAETMVVDVSEIEKCKEEAEKAGGGATPAAEQK